jgi:hypothetical protein
VKIRDVENGRHAGWFLRWVSLRLGNQVGEPRRHARR